MSARSTRLSAGVVVARETPEGWRFLLLRAFNHWDFPKGMVEDGEYQKLPARLRMNVIGNPGIDKLDFELLCLAVSAVNGCGMCVTSHEHKLREGGISREQIQSAVRIASVIHAVAGIVEDRAAA